MINIVLLKAGYKGYLALPALPFLTQITCRCINPNYLALASPSLLYLNNRALVGNLPFSSVNLIWFVASPGIVRLDRLEH